MNQRKHSRSALISLEEEEKKKHSLDAHKEYLQSEECTKAVSAAFFIDQSSCATPRNPHLELPATARGYRSGPQVRDAYLLRDGEPQESNSGSNHATCSASARAPILVH